MNSADLDRQLTELGRQDPPEAALTAVRARVMAVAGQGKGRRWAWILVPVLLAEAAVALYFVVPRRAAAPRVEVAQVAPVPPLPPVRAALPAAIAPVRMVRAPRRPAAVVAPTEFVKLITDDPDVVILWSME